MKVAIAFALAGQPFLDLLAAVDAEKGITQPTPGPTQVFRGEKFLVTDQGFPVVEVIGVRTIYSSLAEELKLATHELHIMWTQVGDDELTIAAHLERLVRATRDLFWGADGVVQLPGVNAGPMEIVSEEYTAMVPAPKHPFVKGAALVIRVQTYTV